MNNLFPFLKKKKEEIFGILDIGSEGVKILIGKKIDGKRVILGKGLGEYEVFGVFDGRDFELEVMKKALKKAIEEAEKEANLEVRSLVVNFPPHIFKARISCQEIQRSCPEELISEEEGEQILKTILKKIKKEVSAEFAQKTGILETELYFLPIKILQMKIDGYEVPQLSGFKGRRIKIRTLIVFLPRHYLKNIERFMTACNLEISGILHEAEGLVKFLSGGENGLFLDIGADFTQIFLVKKGNLVAVSVFKQGGKIFSTALCQKLGVLSQKAQEMVRQYQKGLYSEEVRARLREIFLNEAKDWLFSLEKKLEDEIPPEEIICFGGGSFFPEIEEVLERKYGFSPRILKIKDFPGIEDRTKRKDNPQFIPAIFLTYVI